MTGIEIHGDVNSRFLTVSLGDVLPCLQAPFTMKWCLLWLEGWSSEEWMMNELPNNDFEEAVNKSSNGTAITIEQVQRLADVPGQIINMILLGSEDVSNLRRYDNDEQMHATCDYVIEVFDSSYLIVHSKDGAFITCLQNTLEGVQTIQ